MKRFLLIAALLLSLTAAAFAQSAGSTANGIQFVSSTPATCSPAQGRLIGVVGSPTRYYICTDTNTWKEISIGAATQTVNAQTGTTYTFVSGDQGKLVTFNNASAIAATLPQATGNFGANWFVDVQNTGAGTVTITPTTSTVDGASTLTLLTNQGVRIVSDGTNYKTQRGGAGLQPINGMTDTWTSGLVTYNAIDMSITDTGSASASDVLRTRIGASCVFCVRKDGALQTPGPFTVQQSDSTSTGGNARGAAAVDLQYTRSAATQVASGNNSVLGGGQQNTSANTASTVAGGNLNVASGPYSTVGGGQQNTASGYGSTIAGGLSGTSSADRTVVAGGEANSVTNHFGSILGGRRGTTRNIEGYNAQPYHNNPIADVNGVSQGGQLILGAITTDNTTTTLRSNSSAAGTTNQVVLPNNSVYAFRISVVARRTDSADYGAWEIVGAIRRDANAAATAIIGTPTVTTLATPSGSWTAPAVAADTTNGALQITVAGANSQTIRWVANCRTVEVTN